MNFLNKIIIENDINIIYHLAASNNNLNPNNFYDLYEINLRGTYALLEACRPISTIKLIAFSSSEEVFGILQNRQTEASYNAYMVSKAASELIIKAHCDNSGQNVAIVRMSNLYGGGDLNFNRLIPSIFQSILHHQPVKLRSNGTHLRDYLYVVDAVNAYKEITNSYLQNKIFGHHLFHLASESRISTLGVVEKIKNICMKQDNAFTIDSSMTTSQERIGINYDLSDQKKIINWQSQTSLERGLRATHLWYSDYFQRKE